MVFAFFKRNSFTDHLNVLPELHDDPIQIMSSKLPFSANYNEESFHIIPKYEYEIYGLVVSYRLHDATGGMMLHALNKDHLNLADYCVVWGQSADPTILQEFDFSNGQFTCQFQTNNQAAWQAFEPNQLSNNHLLAIDVIVRDTIKEVKIGDQIHIKGWLAHYQNPMGYERSTSTTRTDTGNGACETIWVEQINILSTMSTVWRKLMWITLVMFSLTLFIYLKSPYIPGKK